MSNVLKLNSHRYSHRDSDSNRNGCLEHEIALLIYYIKYVQCHRDTLVSGLQQITFLANYREASVIMRLSSMTCIQSSHWPLTLDLKQLIWQCFTITSHLLWRKMFFIISSKLKFLLMSSSTRLKALKLKLMKEKYERIMQKSKGRKCI